MRIQIQFTHMDRSESLEDFVIDKVGQVIDAHANGNSHVLVWLVAEHSHLLKGAPEYKCEIEVRQPRRSTVFIKKSSNDLYEAIMAVADTLKVSLREQSRRKIDSRNNAVM